MVRVCVRALCVEEAFYGVCVGRDGNVALALRWGILQRLRFNDEIMYMEWSG